MSTPLLTDADRAEMGWLDMGVYSCGHEQNCPTLPCQYDREDLWTVVERIVREHARQAWEQGVDVAFIAISSPPYMGRGGITNPYDFPEEG